MAPGSKQHFSLAEILFLSASQASGIELIFENGRTVNWSDFNGGITKLPLNNLKLSKNSRSICTSDIRNTSYKPSIASITQEARRLYKNRTDAAVCIGTRYSDVAKAEARRRGLSCGTSESGSTQVATTSANTAGLPACPSDRGYWHNCFGTRTFANGDKYVGEFRENKFNGRGTYTFGSNSEFAGDKYVGEYRDGKKNGQFTVTTPNGEKYVGEYRDGKSRGEFQNAERRTGVGTTSELATLTNNQADLPKSAALNAAQKQAEDERQKRIRLEQELAALKAQKEQQQLIIAADNQVPLIDIFSVNTVGKQGLIKGRVSDNTGIAEVTLDGDIVPVSSNGSFEYRTLSLQMVLAFR